MKIELEHIKQQGLIDREELKLAASVATAAEKTEQADRHVEAKLLSEQARAHDDREHEHDLTAGEREHGQTQAEAEREHKLELARLAAKAKAKPAAKRRATK